MDFSNPIPKEEFIDKLRDMYERSILHMEDRLDTAADSRQVAQLQKDILSYMEWNVKKTELRYHGSQRTPFPLIRFGIYWAQLGWNVGSEYNKMRPVIVITAVPGSPIASVIPLSTKRVNDGRWYHVNLENQQNTGMCEHLKVISRARIVKPLHAKSQEPGKAKHNRISTLSKIDIRNISAVLKRMYGNIHLT